MDRDQVIRKGRMRIHSMGEDEHPQQPIQDLSQSPDQNSANGERYQQLELIGQGSVGEVFKAYDTVLKRAVALKLFNIRRAGMETRYLREAQAQARVQHPNVCKVYDVGEINNRPYIAMQYINGQTLGGVAEEMSLQQKVDVMKTVTEAVHAANRTGLIHRDLKPGNILIERTEDGCQPYVTDFGLAREIDAPDLTRTGVVIGTPAYMSPEQARGIVHDLDQRTDVYCLGATFYELLSGKPPFEGSSSVEVLLKILDEEAPPVPSDQKIPKELETIVMKCLEKDPKQRYESARALSEDLARFQDGEPILARPATWHYRLLKKARKNRTIVGIAALAFVGVILSAAFGVYSWWNTTEQAKHAQQFGQEMEKIEGFLRYAQTLPLHDIRPEIAIVRDRMKTIEKRVKEIGNPAEGPGYYALGRGYLALHEYEKARAHLESVWKRNYRTPEVAYALGSVFGELYQKELQTLRQISNPELRENRQKEIERQYREPALVYLRAAEGIRVESVEYVKGLIALYEKNYDLALKETQKAIQSTPWFYQSRKLEGDVYQEIATDYREKGNYQEAQKYYEHAGKAYEIAINMARSDPDVYEGECSRWNQMMDLRTLIGTSPLLELKNVEHACNQLSTLNPDSSIGPGQVSYGYSRLALYQTEHGENAEAALNRSIEFGEKALRLNPKDPDTAWHVAMAHQIKAEFEYNHGSDPRQSLQRAISQSKKAIQIDSGFFESYTTQGEAYSLQAEYERIHGIDPTKSFENSIGSYLDAIKVNPNFFSFATLGYAYVRKAEYEMAYTNVDPMSTLNEAVDAARKAINLNPRYAPGYRTMAHAYWRIAQLEKDSGLNPSNTLKEGIEICKKGIEIDPNFGFLYNMEGLLYVTKAEYYSENGMSPLQSIEDSIISYQKGIRLNPNFHKIYDNLGYSYVLKATFEMGEGQDPLQSVNESVKSLKRLIETNPSFPFVYRSMARALFIKSKYLSRKEKSPETEIEESLEMINEAIRLNPKYYGFYLDRGKIRIFEAKRAKENGMPVETLLKSAEGDFRKAVQLKPNDPSSQLALAHVYRYRCDWFGNNLGNFNDCTRNGLQFTTNALSINPKMAEAFAVRGALLFLEATHEKEASIKIEKARQASSSFEQAFKANKHLRMEWETVAIKSGLIAKLQS